jgi:hypothetical protein
VGWSYRGENCGGPGHGRRFKGSSVENQAGVPRTSTLAVWALTASIPPKKSSKGGSGQETTRPILLPVLAGFPAACEGRATSASIVAPGRGKSSGQVPDLFSGPGRQSVGGVGRRCQELRSDALQATCPQYSPLAILSVDKGRPRSWNACSASRWRALSVP